MELKDYRAFTWVQDDLTYEVVSPAFYHNDKLYCACDVWNRGKTQVLRRIEILYSTIEAKYADYLKAKEKVTK